MKRVSPSVAELQGRARRRANRAGGSYRAGSERMSQGTAGPRSAGPAETNAGGPCPWAPHPPTAERGTGGGERVCQLPLRTVGPTAQH